MFAPVASNMEHITPASCNEDGGKYPLLEHHQFNTSAHHRNMPLFDESAHSFSLGALPQQNRGHSTSQNQPLLHSQAAPSPPHSEPHRGEAGDALLSGYNNYVGYASSVNQSVSSNYVGHLSYGTLLKTGILPDAPTVSCTSPEAVLDVLSVIQQKLQQMQDVVQLMVQGGGQHAMPQQQQSLAAGVASIMSQLFAATAGLLQQPAPSSIQFPPSAPQLNQAFDLRFDGFHDDGVNNPLSASLGSFMDSSHESFFPSNSGRSTLMGGVATSSATRVAMGGSGIGKVPGLIDQRLKEQALISSSGDPKNCLATGNTPSNSFEIEFTKESPSSAVEAGNSRGMDGIGNQVMLSLDDHDYASVLREDDDDGEGENLPPGSYELMEMAAAEILAEHTHFCEICGKGFKRDANLRMHMRGHGDEYKTPSALARPDKTTHGPSVIRLRRYSCPYVGCKRNKKHRKFQPLKTMLCVKNHYRRSHCPKLLTCSKCKTKKFSVVADLKTHEKHCGRDKWQCSCGTTFSRKDKLFGHISLFAGHTPAVPIHETESPVGGIESSSGCFSSGYGEGLEGLTGNEAAYLGTAGSANVAQGSGPAINATLMTGSSNGMDMTGVSVMGQGVHRSDGNSQQYSAHRGNCLSFSEGSNGTLMGDGSSSSSSLVGALGSDSSMLYDLLPGNFLHQVDGSN